MIRFRRLFDLVTDADRRQLAEIQGIFRKAFPFESEVADGLGRYLTEKIKRDFEPIILVAEDTRNRTLGFTVTFFFSEIKYAYLQYIASDPERSARGIGGALYEATREFLAGKGCRGMFLEVPPDEAEKLKDKNLLSVNRKRMRFYERYGALPVQGTLFDVVPNKANEGYLTMLLYDPLGRTRTLHRQEARRAVEQIYRAQYGLAPTGGYVRQIIESFRDDPVRLRSPRHAPLPPLAPEKGRWLRPIKIVVTDGHHIHHLREKGYVERPVRVQAVLRGLENIPFEQYSIRHFGEDHIRAVHDRHLVDYLAAVCARLGPNQLVYPEVFPIRRPEKRPDRKST
ncbi:MAG: GNAT family N-acetyltransferase, partial [Rhodospirillales bacterium]